MMQQVIITFTFFLNNINNMPYTQNFTSTCSNNFDKSLVDEKSVTVATKTLPRFLHI